MASPLPPIVCGFATWITLKYTVGTIHGVTVFFSIIAATLVLYVYNCQCSTRPVINTTSQVFLYLTSWGLSTVLYRLSWFHPLASIPGPTLPKISSMFLAYKVHQGRRFENAADLHERYGDIVRLGPNNVSVNHHQGVQIIYTTEKGMDKSPSHYELGNERGRCLFFMPTKKEHDKRRKLWAGAFSSSSLRQYEPSLVRRTSELIDCISIRKDNRDVVSFFDCITCWSYDVMGELAFGGSNELELMRDGDPKMLARNGQLSMVLYDTFSEVQWLFQLIWNLPISREMHSLADIAHSMLHRRLNAGENARHDIFGHLLTPGAALPMEDLKVEAMFAIESGFDTISTVGTLMFYNLIRHPDAYKKLQEELDEYYEVRDIDDASGLAKLPYLTAVVEESIRLCSPASNHSRIVPKEGIVIGKTFIPGGTVVSVPVRLQSCSERYFYPDPNVFRPERWLPEGLGPGSRCNKGAILSFQFGTFACLGKSLSYLELRILVAKLVHTFDMEFASGFDPDFFISGVKNLRTTLLQEPLLLRVRRRDGKL